MSLQASNHEGGSARWSRSLRGVARRSLAFLAAGLTYVIAIYLVLVTSYVPPLVVVTAATFWAAAYLWARAWRNPSPAVAATIAWAPVGFFLFAAVRWVKGDGPQQAVGIGVLAFLLIAPLPMSRFAERATMSITGGCLIGLAYSLPNPAFDEPDWFGIAALTLPVTIGLVYAGAKAALRSFRAQSIG